MEASTFLDMEALRLMSASIYSAVTMSAALWSRLRCTGDNRSDVVAALMVDRFFGIISIRNDAASGAARWETRVLANLNFEITFF